MNMTEIRGFATDFNAEYEGTEPGVDSTRRPRVPAGIAIPQERSRWGGNVPKRGEHDSMFSARALNAIERCNAIPRADEVEDALIALIDETRNEQVLAERLTEVFDGEDAYVDGETAPVSKDTTNPRRRIVNVTAA